MRLEIARITDATSVAHVSPERLVALMKHRAPLLAARALTSSHVTLEELAGILGGVEPQDEADHLLEDLHLIARVCSCDAAEDLLLEKGIALSNVSVGDALAHAALESRAAFEAIADHATVSAASKGSTFTSFASSEKRENLAFDESLVASIRASCASFFDELGQGSHCGVRFYREDGESGVLIDHAGARRTERLINEQEKPEIRQFRPFRHDVILLQRGTGRLRVLARSEKERYFYAQLVGELLTGNKDFFVAAETYVLDAIAQSGYAQILSDMADPDIERVVLREIRMAGEDDFATRQLIASNDVLGSLKASDGDLDAYVLKQARFSVVPRVRNGRRCFRITVWKGNRISHDAPWSSNTIDEILHRLHLRRDSP